MITATRQHSICMGHRVYNHEGKCSQPHGHNYKFEFTIVSRTGISLDTLGRVIDFSRIKEILCKWLEVRWDHKMLLYQIDPLVYLLRNTMSVDSASIITLPVNPTAENIAKYFVEDIAPGLLLNEGVDLIKCIVWETDKCFATYEVERRVNAADAVGDGRRNMGKEA